MKLTSIAGENHEVFVAAVFAFHASKAVVQIAAIEIPVDDLLDIGTEKSILPFKSFLINLEKSFKMILHAPVIIGSHIILSTNQRLFTSYDDSSTRWMLYKFWYWISWNRNHFRPTTSHSYLP